VEKSGCAIVCNISKRMRMSNVQPDIQKKIESESRQLESE